MFALRWKVGGTKGWGRRKEGRYLDFRGLSIRRPHKRILLTRDTIERTKGVGSLDARNFRVSITHERVPYFDGAFALEDIDPNGAPKIVE